MTFSKQVAAILEMQKAPSGKFRVLGVDLFTNAPLGDSFVIADCDDEESAFKMARAHGTESQPAYVYNANGKYLYGIPK